ncbi:hypothetical protein XENOCAPTIV_027976 [Xenoophorus captivus]|uniref:DH domain-containing protein n=1 Tax=Xenoophorus captivus TaxID=1517983 RepID=A0ABV0QEV6_9TELE
MVKFIIGGGCFRKQRWTRRVGPAFTIMEEDEGHPGNGIHVAKDSDRQQRLRLCVLNEILNTERDYVRTLLFLQSVSLTFTTPLSRWVPLPTFLFPTQNGTDCAHIGGQHELPGFRFPTLTDVNPTRFGVDDNNKRCFN